MFDDDGTAYGACSSMYMRLYTGYTHETTDNYYAEDPNIDEGEHEYAYIAFSNVHDSSATSGQWGCTVCLEVGSEEDTTFSSGDKGLGWCWGENASTAGSDTAFVSYGTIKATDDAKVMLEETNGWDATTKLILEDGEDGTEYYHYRFASRISTSGSLVVYSKNLATDGSKGDLGFSFGSDAAIKCYCSETLTSQPDLSTETDISGWNTDNAKRLDMSKSFTSTDAMQGLTIFGLMSLIWALC